ncbi:MAG: DsbC family protein [Gammaproteobacteria bacterium]|nr:DsbC family protein [Gammaproteobacteria bacterium]
MMKLFMKLVLSVALLLSGSAFAGEAEDLKALKDALVAQLPAAKNAVIKPTPVAGLYEVSDGGQVMYMTKDPRYMINGDLFDLKTRKNLTETARGGERTRELNKLGESNMLVYKPKGETKHTITVFTDIYCPYCRKMHAEMDGYLAAGIKVRYLFLPFKGEKSFEDSVSVWCAKDRNKAMDKAKAGETIEAKTCVNPIAQQQAVGMKLGINGTPAIILEDGELLPGYVPADKLAAQLNAVK